MEDKQGVTVLGEATLSHAGYHTELDHSCTYCELRYPKYYHMHTWNDFKKLDSKKMIGDKIYYRDAQEEICKKYNVTLVLYRTKWERRFDRIEHIINLIIRGSVRFKKALNKLHEKNQKRTKVKNPKDKSSFFENLTMSERDYKNLTGRTTDQDLSFITSRGRKPDMSYLTGKGKRDYSGLLGNGKHKPVSFDMGKRDYSGLLGKKIKGSKKKNTRGTLWK